MGIRVIAGLWDLSDIHAYFGNTIAIARTYVDLLDWY